MPNLLAMSFEGELTPSFDLGFLQPGAKRPDGWGVGHYPPGGPSATVLKAPANAMTDVGPELLKAWDSLESSTFLLHVRTATWGGVSDANTQPFARIWGGREWLFGHSGSLDRSPELMADPLFEPVGATDSERIFCELMNRIAARRWRSLDEADPAQLRAWLEEINTLGTLNLVLTDGRDLCVYNDRFKGGLFTWTLLPPYEQVAFKDPDVEVDLTRRGTKSRRAFLVSSRPMASTAGSPAEWKPLPHGALLLVRQSDVRKELLPESDAPPPEKRTRLQRPGRAEPKRLLVTHRTVYRYETPVERSMHVLRLIPTHDRLQTLLSNDISFSVEGQHREYDDVFGNHVRRVRVDRPFSELVIEAKSRVQLLDTDPLSFQPLRARSTIPLVWMPWQRHMLQPFLLPPELPESELTELTEYAMSFVKRADYDLLDTVLGLNETIFREYTYAQGSTTLITTPFQVYATRKGVCQDFANLFICLMRLLGVPARYVCGYLYTGDKHPNQAQSLASHAWVQVYLPEVGWRGFDPTNGVLTQTDHIRVAVGRSYTDATPTSGTLFVGGGTETLDVDVRVVPDPGG